MKARLNARKRMSGFTLVELLVVLAILGMLAALVGPQVLNQLGGAKSKSAAIQIRDFEQALELYKLDTGRFPRQGDGLEALVRKPSGTKGWNGPYLKKDEIPEDPWGKPSSYNVRIPRARACSRNWWASAPSSTARCALASNTNSSWIAIRPR